MIPSFVVNNQTSIFKRKKVSLNMRQGKCKNGIWINAADWNAYTLLMVSDKHRDIVTFSLKAFTKT